VLLDSSIPISPGWFPVVSSCRACSRSCPLSLMYWFPSSFAFCVLMIPFLIQREATHRKTFCQRDDHQRWLLLLRSALHVTLAHSVPGSFFRRPGFQPFMIHCNRAKISPLNSAVSRSIDRPASHEYDNPTRILTGCAIRVKDAAHGVSTDRQLCT